MRFMTMPLGAALVAAGLAGPAAAQQSGGGVQEEVDTSGTNPAVLQRSLSLSNEYRFLSDSYYDITNLRYTEPFPGGKAAVRLTLPFNASDLTGDSVSGFGDFAAKFTWIPHANTRHAFVLSTEIFAPTADEDALGEGKWVAAPGLTYVRFLSREVIVAPALIHNFSFAGDDDRPDVSRTDFDLYVVYRPQGKRWWITSDITVSHDFETDVTPVSWELNIGRNLAKLAGGAALNGYIRPGIGIGADRPYDANIEVGLSLVNF
ncbi:hypothetical protein [Paracoccus salipaludis]|uniref:Transporter n=1 Tax=Paracoccus salipaludis TaxID=2032623 RepID=A0A2A2GFS9_9RHOB|nr:hypothetical protein [Paracoccus salipaludis]PAU96496.1 hypothetical protein CK240_13135 [Paracoccus salipaludis]